MRWKSASSAFNERGREHVQPAVIAVAGATASGKSDLALRLAKALDGEIVCMDSMQIYRRMDIGTAKPTYEERTAVPHHMLDIIEPTETYAAADYAAEAEQVIAEIASHGKTPVLVGGTGLYLKTLLHGMPLGGVKGDEQLRARLHAIAAEPNGRRRLHARLEKSDPETAKRLHENDVRRVIRALEVLELTGVPMSRQPMQQTAERPFRLLPLALYMPRDKLFERIEKRVHCMLEMGLLREVDALLKSGVPPEAQSMQGIGYKELVPVLAGETELAEATRQMVVNTRHYAKRQNVWLRGEPETVWLDAGGGQPLDEALEKAEAFLNDVKGTLQA